MADGFCIQFVEPLYGQRKNKCLDEHHFLILPSKSENFGNVVLESMARSRPVLCSSNTTWANVEKLGCGFVFTPELESLMEALERASHLTRDDYDNICSGAFKFSKAFSKENLLKEYKNFYNELL